MLSSEVQECAWHINTSARSRASFSTRSPPPPPRVFSLIPCSHSPTTPWKPYTTHIMVHTTRIFLALLAATLASALPLRPAARLASPNGLAARSPEPFVPRDNASGGSTNSGTGGSISQNIGRGDGNTYSGGDTSNGTGGDINQNIGRAVAAAARGDGNTYSGGDTSSGTGGNINQNIGVPRDNSSGGSTDSGTGGNINQNTGRGDGNTYSGGDTSNGTGGNINQNIGRAVVAARGDGNTYSGGDTSSGTGGNINQNIGSP
ncbi:hypothetical protein FA95DRAFT_321626 [Auriscalpium vulgare]|uniref:Uncharacterized protein n=1 Tax=Auriscalpium vulgare TaxID=40419 RepID=A0ACB8S5A9_9AGAM|nr:hypothetical protein FA95DRAFT_321626 [Auriscalpium vulgare]